MTRLCYDAVNAWAIPTSAPMVAGYVDCSFAWGINAWARFPNAVKVRIAAGCDPQDAQVADVENGDYLPWEAVDFCLVQRAKGIDPTVYVNLSNWNPTRTEFVRRGVPEPHWWLALYDGVATIPSGCVAKQYANSAMTGGNYDLSIAADFWPGVDGVFGPGGGTIGGDDMLPDERAWLQVVKTAFLGAPPASVAGHSDADLLTVFNTSSNDQVIAQFGQDGYNYISALAHGTPLKTLGGGTQAPEPAEPKTVTLHVPAHDVPGEIK